MVWRLSWGFRCGVCAGAGEQVRDRRIGIDWRGGLKGQHSPLLRRRWNGFAHGERCLHRGVVGSTSLRCLTWPGSVGVEVAKT